MLNGRSQDANRLHSAADHRVWPTQKVPGELEIQMPRVLGTREISGTARGRIQVSWHPREPNPHLATAQCIMDDTEGGRLDLRLEPCSVTINLHSAFHE